MTRLTELVLQYQATGTGFERLRRQVEQWVYYYPTSRPGFEDEDCADFLLYFRGRIPSLVNRYAHTGRSFEHYLAKTMRWQLRSFARTRRRRSRMHELTRSADIWDGLVGVAEGEPEEPRLVGPVVHRLAGSSMRRSPRGTAAKRIVILALKASMVVSDGQLAEVARITGYSRAWLIRCRDELRSHVGRREGRRTELRQRRNRAFFRLRLAQDELAVTTEEHRRERIRAELEQQARRLRAAQEQLARVPLVPTNGEIAETIGMPKGSVDSALHYMKRNLVSWQSEQAVAERSRFR
jgi:hypothetical protein